MTKYLILVKHSVPEMVTDDPANTWKLSAEGRLRAGRLADELARFEPDVVFSSDEPKAHETAEIVARKFQLDLQLIPALREHDRSNVPFLSHDVFQASIRNFFRTPDELVFGAETANAAHARFYQAIHSILREHRNKTVIIVTHGTVISLFVSRLTGTSDLELWSRLGLPSYVAMDLNSSTVLVSNIV